MRSILSKLMVLAVMALTLSFVFPAISFAADAASAPAGFEFITPIMSFIMGIPTVGPVVLKILGYMGFVSAFLTALSVFLQALLVIPEVALRFAQAPAWADKVKALSDKVLPWVKYLSMFNVQKSS